MYAKSIPTDLKNCNCVIIMTPWKQYSRLNNNTFNDMKNKIIIDTRRMLTKKKLKADYIAIGIGN